MPQSARQITTHITHENFKAIMDALASIKEDLKEMKDRMDTQ